MSKRIARSRKSAPPKTEKHKKLKRISFTAQFTYDSVADAAYIYLDGPIAPGGVKRTLRIEGNPDIMLDLDKERRLIGIELLGRDLLPSRLDKRRSPT